ncbi:hypothetical protein pb186bvf_014891 [Paramecium bursaria]
MISFQKNNEFENLNYDWEQLDDQIFVKIKDNKIVFYNFAKEIQQTMNYKDVLSIKKLQGNQYIIKIAIKFYQLTKICKIELDNLKILNIKTIFYSMRTFQFDIIKKKQHIFYFSFSHENHYTQYEYKILMRCQKKKDFLQTLTKFDLQFFKYQYFFNHFRDQASFILQIYSKVDQLRECFKLNTTTTQLIQKIQVKNDVIIIQPFIGKPLIYVVDYNFFLSRNGIANWFKLESEDLLIDSIIFQDTIFILVERAVQNYLVFSIEENSLIGNTPRLTIKKVKYQKKKYKKLQFRANMININLFLISQLKKLFLTPFSLSIKAYQATETKGKLQYTKDCSIN